MTPTALPLTRPQILAFRRRVGALDEHLPPGPDSLRRTAWAGLQDSVPRAALLSIHARVETTPPTAWRDPSLVQLWGPRYSAYVVAAPDIPIFSLGRLPDDPRDRLRADTLANRLEALLDGREMTYRQAGDALGVDHNALRYAATTGRVLIRWDGARPPVVRMIPAPGVDPADARLELARRYLHVFGPATPEAFAKWAGIPPASGAAAFRSLADSLTPVTTPVGDRWILPDDESAIRSAAASAAASADLGPAAPGRAPTVRLLPSGDAYTLLHGDDRALLLPDPRQRDALWTPRVWPGALLVDGDVVGTWRRAQHVVTIQPWVPPSPRHRDAVEAEAASLPLPGVDRPIAVRWDVH